MMAENSAIEWTDTTWNPLAGCTRDSEGCDHCYAAVMSLRLEAMAQADIAAGKDPGGKKKYIGIATKNNKGIAAFNGRINLDEDALMEPYRWRKPRRVFVNSMSDLFHKDVPEWFILSAFNVMKDNPQHTFQVLTKRPERAVNFAQRYGMGLPRNVWIGTSVENQEQADKRIPELLKVPAAVRFLSCEPLLGPVTLLMDFTWLVDGMISWVIVGGESGHNARPMHPDWVRAIRDECIGTGTPFLFKQWGEWLEGREVEAYRIGEFKGERFTVKQYSVPTQARTITLCKVGKHAAGRQLDGVEWNQFPQVVQHG